MAVPSVVPKEEAFLCSGFYQGTVVGLFDLMVEVAQKTRFVAVSSNLSTKGEGVVRGEPYLCTPKSVPPHAREGRRSVRTPLQRFYDAINTNDQ